MLECLTRGQLLCGAPAGPTADRQDMQRCDLTGDLKLLLMGRPMRIQDPVLWQSDPPRLQNFL